jgi:hypothetical protein
MTNEGNRALIEIIDSERQLNKDLGKLINDLEKQYEESEVKYNEFKDSFEDMYGIRYLSKMDTLNEVKLRLFEILIKM